MSTKKENIALNVGFRLLSKEACRTVFKRIGASHAGADSGANAEVAIMKICGMHMYSTSRQSES
jgi:hypothetical protein